MNNLVIPGGRRALPTPLTQAEKQAIEDNIANVTIPAGVAANTADIARINNVGVVTYIFVNAASGSDGNTGATSAQAVQTWQKMLEILSSKSGRTVYVYFETDIVADHMDFIYAPPASIVMSGQGGTRTITLNDATNHGSFPGGLFLYSSAVVAMSNLTVSLNTTRGYGLFYMYGGFFSAILSNVTVTQVAGNTGSLITRASNYLWMRVSNLIRTGAEDKVVSGLSSGSTINVATNGISSNLSVM